MLGRYTALQAVIDYIRFRIMGGFCIGIVKIIIFPVCQYPIFSRNGKNARKYTAFDQGKRVVMPL